MEYDDIGIKDEDDVLEAMKAGAYAEQLYESYGDRIINLLLAAIDKKFHGKTWGTKQWKKKMSKIYYFGCVNDRDGHDMYNHHLRSNKETHYFLRNGPWGYEIDGGLCPLINKRQVEGIADIHQKDGWTAIAFWDRTGDSRSNSNSAFIVEGEFEFGEMLAMAKKTFPQLFERFKFEIRACGVRDIELKVK
jgi:hypothetical protein